MKTAFKISMMANVIMFASLVYILKNHPNATPESRPLKSIQSSPEPLPTQLSASIAAPSSKEESKPFQWAQIESSDYRQYVANLRAIGCPQQTIRDIVTADVDTLYAPKRAQLQQKSKDNIFSQPAVESQMAQLQNEEATVLASLLGDTPPSTARLAATTPAPVRNVRQKPPAQIALPLAIQEADLSTLKLGAGQIQAINGLRERFLEEIGGPNQDPNDPGYRERWQKAQPALDDDLRGMIGSEAFQEYQLAARAASRKQ